ncbi:MAG: DUF1177 domain-containing protein [Chloroflexi bacterium]|nr:DUF1177 domain-containing protein [Chloroflexota bacterium]
MLREVVEVMEVLETPRASGNDVAAWLRRWGAEEVQVVQVSGEAGSTDFVKIRIPGRSRGPTLGVIGRLGGVGARPSRLGLVSDADGAIVALACAAKLARMASWGDVLPGNVLVATHVCPNAPTIPHDPTPFMDAPVEMEIMNQYEVDERMEAVLSVDATKGNWVINRRGFAISPTVKEGYILRPSDDLLEIMRCVTGEPPVVFPITTQDITPYGNGIYHLNSILQPATATAAPVVGVATTAAIPVPGCCTGANYPLDLELAARFCVEVAKAFTACGCRFYDPEEFSRLLALYGPLTHLQTLGNA